MISPALNEKFYREYMTFFEQAERTRRWNPFTDVDWDALKDAPRDDALALCAETFCGVEMYLPDYLDGHLDLFRDNWARAWFAATWGYEESKHALTLWRYLVKSGYRTDAQMHELAGRLLAQKWRPPFTTGRTMTVYGAVQEMTTFVFYAKQRRLADSRGHAVLADIYKLIAKDEMAHAQYYEMILRHYLDEDREGTLSDVAHVFYNFTMPAYDLLPDYDSRVEVMRTAGIDRGVFLTEVWGPVLKRLGLTRHDLPRPSRRRRARPPRRARRRSPRDLHAGGLRRRLRHLERVLPALARRADALHVRRLRRAAHDARAGAAQQEPHPGRLRRGHRRLAGARHRLRLGRQPRVPRRERHVKRAHGITLSRAQHEEITARKLPGVETWCVDYKDFVPPEKYDALISIEMIDHLVSPAQQQQGLAVDIYREYFNRVAGWVKPGARFGFQAILRDRVPRRRKDLEDLKFTADVIFPGGLNPRLEELVAACGQSWEIVELDTRRVDYGKTTAEWLRRLRVNEQQIMDRGCGGR